MCSRFCWPWAAAVVLAAGCSRPELSVVSATYGANCGAPAGNATAPVAGACDGRSGCSYRIDVAQLGDPATGCAKDFSVLWRCSGEESIRFTGVDPEAGLGSMMTLACGSPAPTRIDVLNVILDRPAAGSAATAAIAALCSGRRSCEIRPEGLIAAPTGTGAPADLRIFWRCEGEMTMRETRASGREPTTLSCG